MSWRWAEECCLSLPVKAVALLYRRTTDDSRDMAKRGGGRHDYAHGMGAAPANAWQLDPRW